MAVSKKPIFYKTAYLAMAIAGLAVVTISVLTTDKRFNQFENEFSRIYRLISHSEIELSDLESEVRNHEISLREIEQELAAAAGDKKHAQNLTDQIKQLRTDLSLLSDEINSKQKISVSLDVVRERILSQFKFMYWMNTLIFVAGIFLTVIGLFALGVHLEVFQDRRKKKREDADSETV